MLQAGPCCRVATNVVTQGCTFWAGLGMARGAQTCRFWDNKKCFGVGAGKCGFQSKFRPMAGIDTRYVAP